MSRETDHYVCVAVLAGRRAAAGDAASGVTDAARESLRKALAAALADHAVDLLISAAASGADLLGIEAARKLGVDTEILLPFDVTRFRVESVTDRGGDWGVVYDAVIRDAEMRGALSIRPSVGDDPFLTHNAELIAEALAKPAAKRLAILAWDGEARGPDDVTADLGARARALGFDVVRVWRDVPR